MDVFSIPHPSPLMPPGPGGGPPLDYENSVNCVGKAFSDVLNRSPNSADLGYWAVKGYAYVDDTNGVAAFEQLIRNNLAYSAEAANDINGIFLSILNRPDSAGGILNVQNALAAGSLTQQGYRVSVADSPEAQNDIIAISQQILNRPPSGADIGYAQMQFIGGVNQAQLRTHWATTQEAADDINTIYEQVLGRAAQPVDTAWAEQALSNGYTQEWVRTVNAYNSASQFYINAIHQQILNRPAQPADVAWAEALLAAPGGNQGEFKANWAYGAEAQNNLNTWYEVVLGRPIDPAGLSIFQAQLAGGTNQAQIRAELAQSSEAAGDIDAYWVAEAGFHARAADIAYWQAALATTYGLADLRAQLACYAPTVAAIYAIHQQILNRPAQPADVAWAEGLLALPGGNQGQFKANWAEGAEAQADINGLYESVLGRPADPTGLAAEEAALVAGQTQAQIRGGLAYSAEAAGDVSTLYGSLCGRAPSSDEVAGMQAAIAEAYPSDPQFTLTGVVNGAGQTFATSDARSLLSVLEVYVTMNSGVTPTLTDMYGAATNFADATQLAAYLLGQAFQSGTASPELVSTYNVIVGWLAQVDQPLLQTGESTLNVARAAGGNPALQQADEVLAQVQLDTAALPAAQRGSAHLSTATSYAQQAISTAGVPFWPEFFETASRVNLAFATASVSADPAGARLLLAAQQFVAQGQVGISQGNENAVQLCTAGADICLQQLAEPIGARILGVERINESGGVTVDVAVDPNQLDPYGTATFHSKSQDGDISGLLETLVTVVLDVTAVVSGDPWLLAVAAAANAGESVQNFAQGNALAGVLDLGAAAGFGLESVSAFANTSLSLTTQQLATIAPSTPTLLGPLGATLSTAQYILAATAGVGALSGIVNSAENGDGVGVLASSLEAAAAVASGLVTSGSTVADASVLNSVSKGLGVAGGVTAGVQAIENGHVADGLLDGLGPTLSVIAQQALADDPQVTNGSTPAEVSIFLTSSESTQNANMQVDQAGKNLIMQSENGAGNTSLSIPSASSGVTIGFGYDLGGRSQPQVLSELTAAGFTADDANVLSEAAGLHGAAAQVFLSDYKSSIYISPTLQQNLLQYILPTYVQAVISNVYVPLTQNQFDALVDFAYNVGGPVFARSNVVADLNSGNFNAAVQDLRAYVYSGNVFQPGLVTKRAAEIQLFNTR